MHVRLFLMTAVIALDAISASAAEYDQALELHYADGSVAEVSLATNPVIKFLDNEINIKGTYTDISVAYDDLCQFGYVTTDNTAIENVTPDIQPIRINGNEVTYDFGTAGGNITVYNMGGNIVCSRSFAEGTGTLPLSGLGAGTYIVRANSSTIKFQVHE